MPSRLMHGLREREPAELRRHRPGRRRYIVIALLVILAGFGVTTAHLFIWPRQGMPSRVDAIVMLNGQGNRLHTAEELGWAHRAPTIVIARGSHYWGHGSICAPKINGVRFICFDPSPSTTRGEAGGAHQEGDYSREHVLAADARERPEQIFSNLTIGEKLRRGRHTGLTFL